MSFEVNLWELIITAVGAIASAFAYVRITTNELWSALNAHKDEDNKFHIDIVQNVIPNAMDKVALRIEARIDRLENSWREKK